VIPPPVPMEIIKQLSAKEDAAAGVSEYLSIEDAKNSKGTNKEKLLNDDDFMSVFGVDKDAFYKMPGWKQKNLKKSKGFF